MSNDPSPPQSTLSRYVFPKEDATGVSPDWFTSQLTRYQVKNEDLKRYLVEELEALKSFHDGQTSIEQAATAITKPISEGPVAEVNSYSDGIAAIVQLWDYVFRDALMEWPANRTRDLIGLLSAISKVQALPHQGKATDDEETVTWKDLPYFWMTWKDAHWMSPGQITRRCKDTSEKDATRQKYLHQISVESQLVAAELLPLRITLEYIINTLERDAGPSDNTVASDDATGETQLQSDFHFPALEVWFKYNVQKLHTCTVGGDVIVRSVRQFESGQARWAFWLARVEEVAENGVNDIAKLAAQNTVKYMKGAEDS